MPEESPEAEENAQFGQRAVERGFVTQDQVKQAAAARQTILQVGLKKSLAEIMVEKGLMTKGQADIVHREVESGGKVKFIGQYELLSKLGEGGMGVVYKARDPSLDRLIALKVLPPNLAKDEKFVARFQREARMAARLDHVNIVSALAVGEADGHHYFAMEFVEGRSVGEILDEKGTMSEDEGVAIIMQIARALKHAWENQLIHRDIKPDNILVANQGIAKLADLGLARSTADDSTRMTQTGTAMGTPYYISPEQARGEKDIDIRTDIYSLGVTLYHMLTGEVPFQGSTAAVVITKRLTEDPPKAHESSANVSQNTSQVIERMMARDREMRYHDPGELLADLELVADGKAPESASEMTLMGASADLIEKDLSRLKETRALVTGGPSKKLLIGAVAGVIVLVVAIGGLIAVVLAGRETPSPTETPVATATEPPPPETTTSSEDRRLTMLEKEASGQLKAITNLIKEGQVKAALVLAKPAQHKYGETRYGREFEAVVNELELQLAKDAMRARAKSEEEDKEKAREKLAESEYARATEMMGRGQLEGALSAARTAARDYADTSWRGKLVQLGDVIAGRVEQKTLAEDKAKKDAAQGKFEGLVRKGNAALAADRFDDAVAAYESALAIKDSPEVRRKIKDANFAKIVASAERLETDGNLDEAIAFYVKALELRDDEQVRGKINALKSLKKFRGLLARAEEVEEAGELERAVSAYKDALEIAPRAEASRIRAKIRSLEEAAKYDELIAAAGAAAAARDWKNAAASAEKVLSVRSEDAAASAILKKARKRLSLPPQLENSFGMRLILVRAGRFGMGSETGDPDERPMREVFLDDYYISDTEVTNAQYERVDPSHASKRKPYSRDDNSPAVRVSWGGAMDFCRRLSAQESRAYRLPTEAEWERAARGTDGRQYPWGNSPASEGKLYRLNFGPGNWKKTGKKDGHLHCSPVRAYPAGVSPTGCYDMAGNVWEWCLDRYAEGYYAQAPKENPAGPQSGNRRVLRGGAWSNDLAFARCSNRYSAPPSREDANIGFRVVLVVE